MKKLKSIPKQPKQVPSLGQISMWVSDKEIFMNIVFQNKEKINLLLRIGSGGQKVKANLWRLSWRIRPETKLRIGTSTASSLEEPEQ